MYKLTVNFKFNIYLYLPNSCVFGVLSLLILQLLYSVHESVDH